MSVNPSTESSSLISNITNGAALKCRVVSTKFTYIPWNNPDNIITLETMLSAIKVMEGVVAPLMAFVGLPTNVLNCLVFHRQGLRDRINLLLFCQALFDFMVEVAVLSHTTEYFYTLVEGNFQVLGPWMTFKYNNGITTLYGFVYVSAFVTTTIACERCLCITHPFTAKNIVRSSTAAGIVISAAVTLVGGHFIVGDKYRIGCVHYTQLNFTENTILPSQFYLHHKQFVDILNGVLYGFGLPCFFLITTIITTIITTVKLKTAAAWRQQMSYVHQIGRHEVAVTKMLIAVSCLFVACTMPMIVAKLLPVFVPDFTLGGRYQNLFMSFVSVLHMTPAINSCLNFFFYIQMGSKFRITLKELCWRKPIPSSNPFTSFAR